MRGSECFGILFKPTVDGDGNALVQDVSVLTNEGRDLGELVVLEVVSRRVGGVNLDGFKVEVVGLRNSEDGCRAGVGL